MNQSTPSSSSDCPKCGTSKKSGKHSCCARGGAWFKRCGDAGNARFQHTWAEGIQACKDFVTPVLVKSPLEIMLSRVGVITYPLSTPRPRNTTQQQTINTDDTEKTVNTCTRNFDDCVKLVKVVVCICVLLNSLR